ncbi:MAG: hypothetical protein ACXVEE_04345 [Polyangiales bacterium]
MKRAFLRAAAIAMAIDLAFAAPSTLRVLRGALPATESRLGDAIASAFGGLTFPLAAAAVAASLFGAGTGPRSRLDRLVAAGAEPDRAVLPTIGAALAATVGAAVVSGILTIVFLRTILHLPTYFAADVFGTAWANALGAAAWSALALAFVVGTAKPARAYIVVGVDLATRLLPGAIAWIAQSAHVGNVLGAPPPRGFLRVPVLPQLASVAFLLVMAALAAFVASRRYRGAARD